VAEKQKLYVCDFAARRKPLFAGGPRRVGKFETRFEILLAGGGELMVNGQRSRSFLDTNHGNVGQLRFPKSSRVLPWAPVDTSGEQLPRRPPPHRQPPAAAATRNAVHTIILPDRRNSIRRPRRNDKKNSPARRGKVLKRSLPQLSSSLLAKRLTEIGLFENEHHARVFPLPLSLYSSVDSALSRGGPQDPTG